MGDAVADLDRLAVLAGRSWRVADLPGGLTNHNVRVTSTDEGPPIDIVVRCSQSDAGLLGIDRDHEHLNTAAAAEAGVGAPVIEYRPDLRMLAIGFLEGRALDNPDFADPGVLTRAADACRRLHAGPRFTGEFDMFQRQATYRRTVAERDFPVPAEYDDHAAAWESVRKALAARPRPTVPCNNDLLAANYIDDGDRVWLIDYEYSGNNEATFELGNTATECDFTARAGRGVDDGVLRRPDPRGPGPGPARGAVQRLRLVAVGLHPGGLEPAGLRLPLLGDGALREGGGRLPRAGLRRAPRGRRRVTELPTRARVVVVGGGIIGCSVAYHLAKLGWTDVLLLEQGHLSGGSTWHAAGLVGPLRATESGTQLVQYSAELYAALEAETGMATGYRGVGGVVVARTEDRMVQLRRTAANAVAYDMECEVVGPARAQELWPAMRVDDLLGALWLPGDGKVNPTDVTQSLAKGARMLGVTIAEKTRVLDVEVEERAGGRRVRAVRTDRDGGEHRIETEIVVNCAGQWAKALGDQVGVTVPLHSAEHFYVVTDAVEGCHPDLPIMRDPDGWTYFKEEVGGLVVGGFEPDAKPWRSPDDLPHPFEFQLLEEDWEHFSVLMDEALVRVPSLAETGIRKFYNGPESFTPDNQFLLGAAPELDGYYVGAGFNSVGIASAGGAGRALAEWIVAGEPTMDLVGVDVRRFAPLPRRQRLAAVPGGGGARAALRDPVAQPRGRVGAPAEGLAVARHAGRRGGGVRHQDGLGAAERVPSRRPGVHLGQAVVAGRLGSGATGHPHRGCGLRPDVVQQVRRRRAGRPSGPAVDLCRGRRRTGRLAASTRRSSTPGRRTRRTSPSPGPPRTSS